MTKYVQKPAGWWQDSKGRMQPPGSYLDRSLRVPPELTRETAGGLSATRWIRHLIEVVRSNG